MKITFLGASEGVTGSNFLVEAAGKKFLVDCGLFQGNAKEEDKNYDEFAFNANEIDFMLLTHAHIDHSGRIPKLYIDGYRGPVYATKATCDLCKIMLPDSGHIQEMEVEWRNRKRKREGKLGFPPLYTAEDAINSLEIFKPVNYSELVDVDENITVRYNDAGHMLGSAIIEVWVREGEKEEKIVFTGDLGNNDIPLLASPTMIDSADYIVMESTYGNRLHLRNDDKAEIFLDTIYDTIKNGGNVIIPSFAVGRTQEILYELNKIKDCTKDESFINKYRLLMETSVYVDSPLAISATEIFKQNDDLFDDDVKAEIEGGDNPLDFDGLKFTRTAEESKALNEMKEPSIIISASGMCDVGRIKHHLKHNLWNSKNTILFVGYQAPGTLGRRIIDGEKKVKIFGEEIAVNARIEYIEGYSGHADQEWLMNFVYSFHNKPKHIILVHGEKEAQQELKGLIQEKVGIPVSIPKYGEIYNVSDERVYVEGRLELESVRRVQKTEIISKVKMLREEMRDMEDMLKSEILTDETKDDEINSINLKLKEIEQIIVSIIE